MSATASSSEPSAFAVPDRYLVQWQRLCVLVVRATGAAAAHIVELEDSNLWTRASAGTRAAEFSILVSACDRRVLETREPHVVEQAADPAAGYGAYAGVPLAWPDGSPFGVLAVVHEGARAFTACDHEVLVVAAASLQHDLATLTACPEGARSAAAVNGAGVNGRAAEGAENGFGLHGADSRGEDFFAAIVHELRTPLVSILGASEALLGGMAGRVTEGQQRLLEVVRRGGDRMVRLVDNLRELVRIESGRFSVERRPIDARDAVRQSIGALRPMAEHAGIHLQGELPEREVPILGDPDRLAQIVLNLVENAVRHARRGVRVTMRVESASVVLAVADDGPGVATGAAEALFEPWRRGEVRHTDRDPASAHLGLGLTIVKRLVEAHGGTVTASSPAPVGIAASEPAPEGASRGPGFACLVRLPLLSD